SCTSSGSTSCEADMVRPMGRQKTGALRRLNRLRSSAMRHLYMVRAMRRTIIVTLITLAACGQNAAEKRAKAALKQQEAEAAAKKKAEAEAEKNPKPKDGDAVKLG